jgi:hypothetical protein
MAELCDGTVSPNVRTHQWLSQWQDADGNIVAYSLRYRSAYEPSRGAYRDVPDNDRLEVSAARISAAQAVKLRNEASRRMPANESVREK